MPAFPTIHRCKPCRHGTMLYNIHDTFIGRSLDLYGEYSEGEVDLFRQIVRPGQLAVDVGANIGTHTVFLAQAVGPAGRVFAFEPQRIIFQTLCGNLALNSITNVVARNAAIGAAPGQLLVPPLDYGAANNFGGLDLGRHAQGEQVAVMTIDSLKLPACHFMKIDVEGMEKAVLDGAVQTITAYRPVLYVENHMKDRSAELIRTIDRLGYKMYWHLPPLFNPRNFSGNPVNVFGSIVSANMLCLRKDHSVQVTGMQAVPVP